MKRNKICIFCGSSMGFNAVYKEKAAELGLAMADNTCELYYGASNVGLMKIIADSTMETIARFRVPSRTKSTTWALAATTLMR